MQACNIVDEVDLNIYMYSVMNEYDITNFTVILSLNM